MFFWHWNMSVKLSLRKTTCYCNVSVFLLDTPGMWRECALVVLCDIVNLSFLSFKTAVWESVVSWQHLNESVFFQHLQEHRMLVNTPKVVVIFLVRLAALVRCSHYFNSNFFFSFGNPICMTALGGICGI